jgi:hypothetical protein
MHYFFTYYDCTLVSQLLKIGILLVHSMKKVLEVIKMASV